MYYILINEDGNSKTDFYVQGTLLEEDGSLAINIFDAAEPVAKRAGNHLTIKLDENYSKLLRLRDRIVTYVQNSFYLLVVSPAMKALLEELNTQNIEYLGVTIKGKTVEISDYFIVNILSKIDCIDDEKSDVYDNEDNTIDAIYSLTLAEEKIPKHLNLFLLGRHEGGIIIAHERLKKAIEERGLKGFVFVDPKEFAL